MAALSLDDVQSLLAAPSPAVLTTYRKDGSASSSPVWYRWADRMFEIVIAKNDPKLGHLTRDPRCDLLVFEAIRPFRGVRVSGIGEIVDCDVTPLRAAIAGRYLGDADGSRFAADRVSTPGVLLRVTGEKPVVWDLSGILPG